MGRTFGQGDQLVNDAALPKLGKSERTQLKDILAAIEQNADSPLRMAAAFPTPDSKLYIAANTKTLADGTKRTSPPTKSQIPAIVNSTIDFQTLATTGATFDIEWPSTTAGQYRRLGLTLLATGVIKGLFSEASATLGGLANPGTIFVKSGIPIGYIDLQAVAGASSTLFDFQGINSSDFRVNLADRQMGAGFTATAGGIVNSAELSLSYFSGTGTVVADLYATVAGIPSGAPLATSNPVDITTLPTGSINPALTEFTFPTPASITLGQTYAVTTRMLTGTGEVRVNRKGSDAGAGSTTTVYRNMDIAQDWTFLANDCSLVLNSAAQTLFKTADSATNIVENAAIYTFGSGGSGGGSGTGDSSSIEEEIKARLRTSRFQWATPNVFSKHENLRVHASTTAVSQITEDNLYLFSKPSNDTLISTQHFDAPFLASDDECNHAELLAFWDALAVDPAAVYSLSRDGGLNYQVASMSRVGTSNAFRGYHVFSDETVHTVLSNQLISNVLQAMNATTAQKRAQSVTFANKVRLRKITLKVNKTGSPNGSAFVRVIRDASGSPSTDLADLMFESTPILMSSLAAGAQDVVVTMTKALKPGTYWIEVVTDAAYKSSFSAGVTQLAIAGGVSGATDSKLNDGTTWSTEAGFDLYSSIEGLQYDLRVKVVSSIGAVKLTGYGVLYSEELLSVPQGNSMVQHFLVDGNTDQTVFPITNFLPDPARLKVYDVETGQVWRYPKFGFDGRNVVFASGSFLVPGQTFTVIFDQSEGAGFDNSDMNALLLASNGLGSTEPTVDRSAAGVGIKLRRPDGVLREITIDNDDNIVIKSTP